MEDISIYSRTMREAEPLSYVRESFFTVARRGLYVGACGVVATTGALIIMKVVSSKIFQHIWVLTNRQLPLLKGTLNAYSIALVSSVGAGKISEYFRCRHYSYAVCTTVGVGILFLATSILTAKLPFPFSCSLRPPEAIYYGLVAALRLFFYMDRSSLPVESVVGRDSLAFHYLCAFLFVQISGLRGRLPLGMAVAIGVAPALLLSERIVGDRANVRTVTSFVISLLFINFILCIAKFYCSHRSSLRIGLLGAMGCSTLGALGAAITTWYLFSLSIHRGRSMSEESRRHEECGTFSTRAVVGHSLIVGAVTIALLASLGKIFSIVDKIPRIKGNFVVAALGGMITIPLSQIVFWVRGEEALGDSCALDPLIKGLIILAIVVAIAPTVSFSFSGFRVSYRQALALTVMGTLCQFFSSRFIEEED